MSTTFTGLYSFGEVHGLTPAGFVGALSDYDGSTGGVRVTPDDAIGPLTTDDVLTMYPREARTGFVSVGFDGQLFEKIIVTPRSRSLGFVLSDNTFTVEVWNSFRNVAQVMTDIMITGSGDLAIDNEHTLPLTYWPYESFSYLANVPQDGAAQITNVATFVFDGIDGTDLTLLGSRLAVFSGQIDWSNGFTERLSYKTIVQQGWSGQEQRIQLRTIPRPGALYHVVTLTPRMSAGVDAMVIGRKSRVYGIPMWQDAMPLASAVSEGASAIAFATTNLTFVAGGLLLLWRDQYTYEAVTIDAIFDDHVTLTTATTDAWPQIGTVAIPMTRGRLLSAVKFSRPAEFASDLELEFSGETV